MVEYSLSPWEIPRALLSGFPSCSGYRSPLIPEILKMVFIMELFAIPSMCEVGSEHKVCFGAFLRLAKKNLSSKKIP